MSVPVIYALHCLHCPSEGIRYVGQTIQEPDIRLRAHIYDSERGRKTGVCGWIRKHGRENIAQVVLEKTTIDNLNDREIWWIAFFLDRGANLHNLTPGGDTKRVFSENDIRDIRFMYKAGKKQAEIASIYGVAQATISMVVKGRYGAGEMEDPARDGKGRPKPHSSLAGEKNAMAVLNWEKVDDMRGRYKDGETIRAISESYGINYALAWSVVREKSWTKRPPVVEIGAAALAS